VKPKLPFQPPIIFCDLGFSLWKRAENGNAARRWRTLVPGNLWKRAEMGEIARPLSFL
jgi:hypothetical protein